jgi:O-antigen/teichoic acid export membrane protein
MSAVKRNLGWLLMSQMATWGMSMLVLLISPRKLGDAAFGQVTFAMVYVGFFELVALLGTGTFIMKMVARDESMIGRYVVNTVVMKALLSSALTTIAISLAVVLGFERDTVLIISVYCLGMIFNVLNNGLAGGLQGLQRMARPAMWEVIRSYVGGVVALLLLLNTGSVILFVLAFNLASAIPLIANGIYLWPTLKGHRQIDVRLWRQLLVGGFPFFVWSALLVVYGTIDIPLLEAFSGSETVGWYGLAYRWVSMPAFFAASVATAFFPALSAGSMVDPKAFAHLANRALRLVFLVSTPAAIGIALVSEPFLRLLYGTDFLQAVPLMRILALHIPIVAMDIVLGVVVVAADRQRTWTLIAVIAAVFNPLLNLAAIPLTENLFDNGAIGAAIITVATEVVVMLGALYLRPEGVLDRATRQTMLRTVLASSTMVPVVLALQSTPLVVQVLAGAITYGLAAIALGTVSVREVRSVGVAALLRGRRQSTATTTP